MHNRWERQEILQLLSLSGTLAGLSIAGLNIFSQSGQKAMTATIVDDVLAFSALLFLFSTFLFFFSLRMKSERMQHAFERGGDAIFLLGLTTMVASGFMIVYTVW